MFYLCMINSIPSYKPLNMQTRQQNKSSASFAPNSSVPAAPKNKTKLSIFYINDMHGNIDNMSGMIAASDKFDKTVQNEGVDALKISAGDNFSGGDDKKNKLLINLLSRMGIDASAVGNHEFDSTISKLYDFIYPDKTKFLAANAKVPNGNAFYNNIQKSIIEEVNGTKYGLIGLMPFDLVTVTGNDQKKLEGIEPETLEKSVELVNEEVKKLQSQGIDRIILVSHIGNDKDKQIAPLLHGVDIIVGGHSHTEVDGVKSNENLFYNADNDPIVIVQTGENAKNVGVLNVEFDQNGDITAADNNLIPTNQEKSPVLNYLKDATMGPSPKIGTVNEIEPLPVNRRTTPSPWTHFMCDAMRTETGADIAFINAANTRKVPKKGTLTERDIMESTPLKNTLLVKKMTEKEIVRAIKDSLQATFSNETGEPGILHVSGLTYVADDSGNLKELNFVDKEGNKTPIDINNPSDKIYNVCYDSFVAKGTEYPVFVPETMTHKTVDKTFDFDKDKLTIDYINKHPDKEQLSVKDDGRIKILSSKQNGINSSPAAETPLSQPSKPVQNNLYSPLLMSRIQNLNSNAAIQTYGQAV